MPLRRRGLTEPPVNLFFSFLSDNCCSYPFTQSVRFCDSKTTFLLQPTPKTRPKTTLRKRKTPNLPRRNIAPKPVALTMRLSNTQNHITQQITPPYGRMAYALKCADLQCRNNGSQCGLCGGVQGVCNTPLQMAQNKKTISISQTRLKLYLM